VITDERSISAAAIDARLASREFDNARECFPDDPDRIRWHAAWLASG
jgi:hypothetical protein